MERYRRLIPRANNRRKRVANCSICGQNLPRVYNIIILIEPVHYNSYFAVTPLGASRSALPASVMPSLVPEVEATFYLDRVPGEGNFQWTSELAGRP